MIDLKYLLQIYNTTIHLLSLFALNSASYLMNLSYSLIELNIIPPILCFNGPKEVSTCPSSSKALSTNC